MDESATLLGGALSATDLSPTGNASQISPSDTTPLHSETIRQWTVANVVAWLHAQKMGKWAENFEQNDITGDLLWDLNHNLLKEMDIKSVGERMRLLVAIKELKVTCVDYKSTSRNNSPTPSPQPPTPVKPGQYVAATIHGDRVNMMKLATSSNVYSQQQHQQLHSAQPFYGDGGQQQLPYHADGPAQQHRTATLPYPPSSSNKQALMDNAFFTPDTSTSHLRPSGGSHASLSSDAEHYKRSTGSLGHSSKYASPQLGRVGASLTSGSNSAPNLTGEEDEPRASTMSSQNSLRPRVQVTLDTFMPPSPAPTAATVATGNPLAKAGMTSPKMTRSQSTPRFFQGSGPSSNNNSMNTGKHPLHQQHMNSSSSLSHSQSRPQLQTSSSSQSLSHGYATAPRRSHRRTKEKDTHLSTPQHSMSQDSLSSNRSGTLPRSESGAMSLQAVKQRTIRVFGEDEQSRVLDVANATSANDILKKALQKFNIQAPPEEYCLFCIRQGAPIQLDEEELMAICRDPNRPEKEKLILKKNLSMIMRTMPKSKSSTFSGTSMKHSTSLRHLAIDVFKNPSPSSAPGVSAPLISSGKKEGKMRRPDVTRKPPKLPPSVTRSRQKASRFFGNRPPSELIESNIERYFPSQQHATSSREDLRRGSYRPDSLLGEDDPFDFYDEEDHEESEYSNSRYVSVDRPRRHQEDGSQGSSQYSSQDAIDAVENGQAPQTAIFTGSGSFSDYLPLDELNSLKIQEPESPQAFENTPATSDRLSVIPSTGEFEWRKGQTIGQGSYGIVCLGLLPSGALCAVKQVELPVEQEQSDKRKMMVPFSNSNIDALEREIVLLRDLNHPNIVKYLGSRAEHGQLNIFLEYVAGGSLSVMISKFGKIPASSPSMHIFPRQILHGLKYLHNKSLIHRDIKAANILVDTAGVVKISDFGISRKVEEGMDASRKSYIPDTSGGTNHAQAHKSGAAMGGSIFWMAPEVVKQVHYTTKSDIWSFGCVLLEMLTGSHPWPNASPMQALFQIGSGQIPALPAEAEEAADLKDLLTKCFAAYLFTIILIKIAQVADEITGITSNVQVLLNC